MLLRIVAWDIPVHFEVFLTKIPQPVSRKPEWLISVTTTTNTDTKGIPLIGEEFYVGAVS